ncbi:O-antigen ligase family protein [Croceimicrobium sp.]|uniref:O-antigen ligase family protein n=1 Tax=Croceimicrobium sp. TaxID=2828340 RepID=UPI003BAC128E
MPSPKALKWLLVLAFIAMAMAYYFDRYWHWIALAFAAGIFCLIVYLKNAFRYLIPGLALILPISVALAISNSAKMVLPAEFIIVILAPIVLIKLWENRKEKFLLRFPWPALWLLSFIPGLIFSELVLVSLKFWILNGLYVLVFYYGILLWRAEGGNFNQLIKLFAWALLPAMLIGLYHFAEYEFNPITLAGIYKPFFYSHTYFGATLAIIAGFALGQISKHRNWWPMAIAFTVLALISGSRAALWSILFMLGIYALLQLKPLWRFALPALAIVLALSFGAYSKIEELFTYNRYQSYDPNASLVEKTMSVTNVQSDVSNIERLNRWVSALRMFEERPHWGFGPGTYQFTYIPFQEKKLENRLTVHNPDSPPEGSGGTAHSELLLQLSENGWSSVVLFCIILGRWFFKGFTARSASKAIYLPFLLGLSTYYFHMHFNNFLNQPAFAFLFWSFGAMIEFQTQSQKE